MAPQWGDDEAHLLHLWLHHTVPGGLNQEERHTWKNVAFRMNKEARTNGITERVFNTYMIRDYYSRTLRPVYDKDFKYAGPQARVANGATDKAANYATQLADIAARTAHRNSTRATKEAAKAARDETKKANVMVKANTEATPECAAKAAESARKKAIRATTRATFVAKAAWKQT
jgi:hypothetical protein